MMLKAFSAIALAALPVRSATDAADDYQGTNVKARVEYSGATWTLNKNNGGYLGYFGGSTGITCRVGNVLDQPGDSELKKNTSAYVRLGWVIKLPKKSEEGKFECHKHEVRFVCFNPVNCEVIYFNKKGTEQGRVNFLQQYLIQNDADLFTAKCLKESPSLMSKMGYTQGEAVLARYKTNDTKLNFYFFFPSMAVWDHFHTALMASVNSPVSRLNGLLAAYNDKALNGKHQFLINCLIAIVNKKTPLAIFDGTTIRMADDVTEDNIEAKVEKQFRGKTINQMKRFLGLAQRRRLATMERLLIETEETLSS